MATLRVTAERLTIHDHTNADALELAQVGLYRAVVGKGQFRTGDWAIYIPEGSQLPATLIDELGLTGKLAGPQHDRVRAIRLRGELSQGIVALPKALADVDLARAHAEDRNFADDLGIVKWIPPVPVHLSGETIAAPDLLPWIEIEDIKRYPEIFEPGEPVVATEKIHGSACLYTLADGENLVASKGFGHQRLGIVQSAGNLYWRAIEAYDIPKVAATVAERLGAERVGAERVGVYGEVYGNGVQDLGYGTNAKVDRPGYAVFDVQVGGTGGTRWLDSDELVTLLGEIAPELPLVPRLYAGPYDQAELMELAVGTESVSGRGVHLREGLVVRPAKERYSNVTGGRAIAKFVSGVYLTRKGGTEYE